jgi:hypothetical protein
MDISNYNFFIGTGCSYGRHIDSLLNIHNINERNYYIDSSPQPFTTSPNTIFINVSYGSQGSDYQSDSIIYTVSKLLELGAQSKNIFCLIEWSEITRTSFPFPKIKEIEPNLNWNSWPGDTAQGIYKFNNEIYGEKHNDNDSVISYLKDNIHFYGFEYVFPKIGEFEYFNANHVQEQNANKNPKLNLIWKEIRKTQDSFSLDFLINRYFDNILKVQWFLKSHNIDFKCYSIYSQFDFWYKDKDGNHLQFHIHNGPEKWFSNDFKLYDELNGRDFRIENVIEYIKPKFDLVDLSKWWFWEGNRGIIKRGGVDEFTWDTFKEVGYQRPFNVNVLNNNNKHDILLYKEYYNIGAGFHPNITEHFILLSKILKNHPMINISDEFISLLMDSYQKDYNSNNISETGLWKSKNHIKQMGKETWIDPGAPYQKQLSELVEKIKNRRSQFI